MLNCLLIENLQCYHFAITANTNKGGSISIMSYYDLTFFRMVDEYQCFRIQITGGKLETAS